MASTQVRVPIKINQQEFPPPARRPRPSASPTAAPEPVFIPSLILPLPNVTHTPAPISPPPIALSPTAVASLSTLARGCYYHRTETEPQYVYTVCPFANITQTKLTWGVAESIVVVGSVRHCATAEQQPRSSCTRSLFSSALCPVQGVEGVG